MVLERRREFFFFFLVCVCACACVFVCLLSVHRCFLCPPRVYDTGWHQQRWLQQLAVMVAVGTLGERRSRPGGSGRSPLEGRTKLTMAAAAVVAS